MQILQVSAEYFPLLKTGGLADVAGALPQALQPLGCEVRPLLPGFAAMLDGRAVQIKTELDEALVGDDIHAAAEANTLVVSEGIPFREAYRRVAAKPRVDK